MSALLPDAEALIRELCDRIRPDLGPRSALVGIHTGGAWLAERLHRELGLATPLGILDVAFYRDDYARQGLARDPKRKFGIAAVFSVEQMRRPESGECAVEGRLSCTGYGSATAVTGSFGFAAASVVLRHLANPT